MFLSYYIQLKFGNDGDFAPNNGKWNFNNKVCLYCFHVLSLSPFLSFLSSEPCFNTFDVNKDKDKDDDLLVTFPSFFMMLLVIFFFFFPSDGFGSSSH